MFSICTRITLTDLHYRTMQVSVALAVIAVAVLCNAILSYVIGGVGSSVGSVSFRFEDIPDLSGKIAVVTGANSGIGQVTARELARKGAYVIATSRDVAKGDSALQEMMRESANDMLGRVEFIKLDLSSLESVQDFAHAIVARNISVDFLFLNAGIMFVPYQETKDGYEWQFGVNHLGHFLLVKLLMSTFSAGCRIVHVSSIGHYFTYFPEGIRFDQLNNSDGYNMM